MNDYCLKQPPRPAPRPRLGQIKQPYFEGVVLKKRQISFSVHSMKAMI